MKSNIYPTNEILIVDDSPDSVKVLTEILVSNGYQVFSVNNGESAIERVRVKKPSVIFLDILMPGMDGFDVCKYLKTQKETVDLPIIFISSLDDEQSILRGYELGGIDYIIKPFREKDVIAKVLPLLRISGYLSKLKWQANLLEDANGKTDNVTRSRKKIWGDFVSEPLTQSSISGQQRSKGVAFSELFNISEIQKLQDQFAQAFGISSIITLPDGTPLTKPSNFTHLCKNIIRRTETGLKNCMYSDSVIGRRNPEGPVVQICLSCGLWDAGASISVGGIHIANWLIGQVRRGTENLESIKLYAREIGANENEFIEAYQKVPVMSPETISNISQLLYTMAEQLSQKAYQTVSQSRYINEKTNAEIALLKSEEKFRKIINSNPVGMLFCDLLSNRQLIIRGNNPSAEQILGIKGKKITGKFINEAFPALMNTGFSKILEKVASKEIETQSIEIEYNDYQIHGIFDVTVFRIENNSIAISFLNISERKLAEKALRESETKFRKLAESINVAISMYQGDRWIYSNPASVRIGGYSADELKDLRIFDIVAPAYKAIVGEIANSRLSGNKDVGDYEMQIITKEGKLKWLYVSGSSLILDGIPTALISGIDITKQKESEILIKQSEELYRSIFQMSRANMLLIDPENGKIIDANNAAVEFYGWTHKKLLKTELSQINVLPIEDIKLEMQSALDNNRNHFLFKHRIADGSIKDVEVYSSRILLNKRQMLFSIVHDVSEKKQVEDQLRQSEERFRKAIIRAPFPIMLHAEDGEVIAISKAWSDFSGYSLNEIPTTQAWSVRAFGKENLSVKTYIDHLYSIDNWVDEGVFSIFSKSGEEKIWDFGSAPLGQLSDGRRLVISMAKDVTDRIRYEESIQKDRILLRTLIDNLPAAIYVKDEKCRKIIANTVDLENIGLESESQALGKTDIELFEGEIGLRGYSDDLQVIQSRAPVLNKEEMFINSDGKIRWMVTSKMPLFDEHNRIAGLVGIGRDVTEQKREKELINKLTKSVEQSPSSLLITDIDGKIEYVNPKFCELTGYTLEDVYGKTPRILKSGKTPDYIYRQLWSSLHAGEIWRGEFYNKKKSGEFYWEWATITPLKDEKGQITNFIAIHEDITLRKQMEADLIFAKEKAEESDRLKSAFLANMSHEIRTPLNSIIGFSELLSDPYFDTPQRDEFINQIVNNGNSLLTIISDIMDISKMESGEITLRKNTFDINKLLYEIRQQYKLISKEKEIEFVLEIPNEENSIEVYTDRIRLRQIFDNLIGNALKFTKSGSINVGYRCSSNSIEFFIKDTGIGIPKKYHSVIFDRFRQVELSLSRKYGGTGLGLAIVKILVEIMGGRIWVESEPNNGSTFYFSIPLQP